MTGVEFAVVLAWLLAPALTLGAFGIALVQRRGTRFTRRRGIAAWLLLLVASAVIAVGMATLGPASLSHQLGMRDRPVPWAPFAFLAVALAFPLAAWWACRGVRNEL